MVAKKTSRKKKGNSGGSFFLGAALGALAGSIVGLLSSPKSGEQNRRDLGKQTKKLAKKAQVEGKKTLKKVKTESKKAIDQAVAESKKKKTKSKK